MKKYLIILLSAWLAACSEYVPNEVECFDNNLCVVEQDGEYGVYDKENNWFWYNYSVTESGGVWVEYSLTFQPMKDKAQAFEVAKKSR